MNIGFEIGIFAKKASLTPRPIRVGEVWRRIIGKRLAIDSREMSQIFLLAQRQLGVSIPRGTDALIHFRRQMEDAFHDHSEAWILLDVDFRNAFPSLEWKAIRDAVERHMPHVLP